MQGARSCSPRSMAKISRLSAIVTRHKYGAVCVNDRAFSVWNSGDCDGDMVQRMEAERWFRGFEVVRSFISSEQHNAVSDKVNTDVLAPNYLYGRILRPSTRLRTRTPC